MSSANMPDRLEAGDLTLSRVTPAHAQVVTEAVQASQREIHRWMSWAHEGYALHCTTAAPPGA